MAYISFDKLWRFEFFNNVSAKDIVKDRNLNQVKLKVHDRYKKVEKITRNFEESNPKDVINKGFLDEKLCKIEGFFSYIWKKILLNLKC